MSKIDTEAVRQFLLELQENICARTSQSTISGSVPAAARIDSVSQ